MDYSECVRWLLEHDCTVGELYESGESFVVAPSWKVAENPTFEKCVECITGDPYEWGFDDEYDTCADCGRILRTEPDCYFWTPDFWLHPEYGRVCANCIDPEEYIQWAIALGATGVAAPVNLIDPEDHGFSKVATRLQYGIHDGMADDPRKIAKWGHDHGFDVVFHVQPSQFYTDFDAYFRRSNGFPMTQSALDYITGSLFRDTGDRILRDEFVQSPTPAECMKRGLSKIANSGARFASVHPDGSITDHGSLADMTEYMRASR